MPVGKVAIGGEGIIGMVLLPPARARLPSARPPRLRGRRTIRSDRGAGEDSLGVKERLSACAGGAIGAAPIAIAQECLDLASLIPRGTAAETTMRIAPRCFGREKARGQTCNNNSRLDPTTAGTSQPRPKLQTRIGWVRLA
jgi:hypothetical protein